MNTRLLGVFVVVLASLAIFAASASAQPNINPGGANAQANQYVQPERVQGGQGPAGPAGPSAPAPAELPFTGLLILPIALAGVGLTFGGLALRRRAQGAS